jgi:transposase
MEIKQILRLHQEGMSNRKIGRQLGMSRNTVNGYMRVFIEHESTIEGLLQWTEEQLQSLFERVDLRDAERYNGVISYFESVRKRRDSVGFTMQRIWERYREEHADGYGYTQFVSYYHEWGRKVDFTLKLHHRPGGSLMVDYTGKHLHWVNKETGELIATEVFIGTLPSSGYTYVEATASQAKEDFIGSMVNCLNYLGGVPEMIVPDNLKSAVTKASKYEAIANRTFRDLADYYDTVLNPTRPASPKDKAHVERSVTLVYQQIFFEMENEEFYSLHALNERLAELLDKFNDRKYSQLNVSRKELFLATEYSTLKPLPPEPYQLKQFRKGKVQKTSHVYLSVDKHYYSVPYRYIGNNVQIHYTERVVEIFHKHQRISSHHRDRTASGYSTKQDHLPSQHQIYNSWNPDLFIRQAAQIGPNMVQYIRRLFEQIGPAEPKYRTAAGLIQLKRQYPITRIEKACQVAYVHPVSSYKRVLRILEKGMDQLVQLFDKTDAKKPHIPIHENLRGAKYYSDN